MLTNVGIMGMGYSVPNNVVENDVFGRQGFDEDKIFFLFGVKRRRWVKDDQALSDLAVEAGLRAMANAKVEPQDIGLLVVNTTTADYLCPAVGCLVQHKLRLPRTTMVYSINAACAGANYGLGLAARMIPCLGGRKALVISGDVLSKFLSWDNALITVLADGAGAAVMGALRPDRVGLYADYCGTRGEYHGSFGVFALGSRGQISVETIKKQEHRFVSDEVAANEVLPQTIEWFKEALDGCLHDSGKQQSDIKLFFPHPVSMMQIEAQMNVIGEPMDKTHYVLPELGHSGGGTAFIAVQDAYDSGKLKAGDLFYMFSNGAGFQWAGALVQWQGREAFAD